MSKKIKFKVSARTARLIGRENVSNAESAIIELVKNSYDADAENCILYFDKNNQLHILDDGHGMERTDIEKYWMTIGTNHKEKDFVSNKGRIKSGEKGIGRFALDCLGQTCELWTKPENGNTGYIWSADWKDFETEGLETVDQIEAELISRSRLQLRTRGKSIFESTATKAIHFFTETLFENGTFLSINQLRDEWDIYHFNRLYKSLGTLIPPKEETNFNVYLFTENYPNKFGKIDTGPCDDFDYKVSAKVDKNQSISITINRNEYDLDRIDNDLFKRKEMRSFPYDKKTFYNKEFTLEKKIKNILPGFKDQDKNDIFKQIGPFDFTFYFMKKSSATKDKERFCYKDFNPKTRKEWLDEYGGIKIFRDGFRVRPYGEINGNSLDWLGLGPRYASSPAGVSRKGGYKVREYNLSGVVNISRVNNPFLRDKSSREGIVENQAFEIFKQLLIGIISEFEKDRSHIQSELKAIYEKTSPKAVTAARAAKASHRAQLNKDAPNKSETEEDIQVLSKHTADLKEEIKELLNEQRILRVLASSGAMFAAFGHELHAMQSEIKDRADTLRNLFSPHLDPVDASVIPDEYNPWIYVDEIETLDGKLLHWMNFALAGIKKDKRNRRTIYLEKYFQRLKNLWSIFLDEREIELTIDCSSDDLKIKAFEVELDTIFNNLLLNSVEVFNQKIRFKNRRISISCKEGDEFIKIFFKDSGTGLSKDIDDPNKIFDLYYSTKRDPNSGKEVGTGIGMYLVKSVVSEYKGRVTLGKLTLQIMLLSL
ncbi:ATP-binding protein [Gimesia chilikensis]|uniref:ATP-binding protein n=1 Tax=Gimesia chilikensis TaxID=2605989 RepID=UPI003A8CEF4D